MADRWICPFGVALIFVLILLCFSIIARGGELTPLQIESGRHNGLVPVIGTDRSGQFLVTASEDKTLRVWKLDSGALLNTFYMPVGSEHQGKLYATAISPDGRFIAAGGYLADESSFSFMIYLLDRQSGRVIKQIKQLDNVCNHLVFSPDGRYLAGLFGAKGVRVWDSQADFAEVARDSDYQSGSYWATFSPQGELATTGADGFVRIYNRSFHLRKKAQLIEGGTPIGLAFSPDGSELAVGFMEAHSLLVASATDLTITARPDVSGIGNGDIAVVKWGADGQLYAGGHHNREGQMQIRRWGAGGRGGFVDLPTSDEVVMDFDPLPDGRLVVVDGKSEILLLAQNGRPLYRLGSGAALHSIVGNGLELSADGAAFKLMAWGEGGATELFFDAHRLELNQQSAGVARHGTKYQSSRLKLAQWHGGKPTLGGVPLPLEMGERSNALAIAVNDSFFVIGTSRALRRYAADGSLIWQRGEPESVRAVNLSTDGKIVVAVLGDKTVRWFDAENGDELLALFVHADYARWVAWTPQGYFACSAGGSELVGHLLNQPAGQLAAFVSFSAMAEALNRPDVVRSAIGGGV